MLYTTLTSGHYPTCLKSGQLEKGRDNVDLAHVKYMVSKVLALLMLMVRKKQAGLVINDKNLYTVCWAFNPKSIQPAGLF